MTDDIAARRLYEACQKVKVSWDQLSDATKKGWRDFVLAGIEPDAINTAARQLYEVCQSVKPNWDQLGDATKDVWRYYVVVGIKPEDYL